MIMRQLTQNRNHASISIFNGLVQRWHFPLPKTEDTDEIKAFCSDWEDKRKIETGFIGDIKKAISEVFRGLEKTLA